MIKKVKTEDLKVGMYVMLEQSWLRHSFMKPNFRITSEKQIKKILHDRIREVKVDTSKSEVIEERDLYRDVLGPRGEDADQARTEAAPPVGPVETTAAPPAGQVETKAAPPVGPVETTAAPPAGQVETKAALPVGQVETRAAPPVGQVRQDAGQVETRAAPPVGQVETKAAPPVGKVETRAAPPVGQVETRAAPPVGQVETKVAPPVGQVETRAAPPVGQVETRAAPPVGKVETKAAPPVGKVRQDAGQVEPKAAPPGSEFGARILPPKPREFNPIDQISEELHRTIQNTSIPPKTKAREVYNHSIKMMTNVLENPRAGSIQSSKKMIYDIVDHILADDDTAECMALITSHDYYTYTHSVNVGMLSVLLAKSLYKGSYDHDMQELGAGFFLHDLGKCDIPHDLINKPGQLTDEEWDLMRNHPQRGNRILVDTDQISKECGIIIMQHHEREDGSGYPFGLSKDEIHPYARICSIADVYDALTSTRAYKQKVPAYEALRIMKEEMVHFFNKEMFNQFVLILKD